LPGDTIAKGVGGYLGGLLVWEEKGRPEKEAQRIGCKNLTTPGLASRVKLPVPRGGPRGAGAGDPLKGLGGVVSKCLAFRAVSKGGGQGGGGVNGGGGAKNFKCDHQRN